MPSEDNKILEFNQFQKVYKGPFINCAILECFIEKIYVNRILKKHLLPPSSSSMFTISSFKKHRKSS